jgi:hypothetical protein
LGRGAGAAALWAALAGTALAGTIVVRASGPSAKAYPAGRQLADNAAITLRAGDTLTVLDGRGTRTLTGPGTFNTGATAAGRAGMSATAMRILSTQTMSERRGGAVRGGPAASGRNPNLWFVDASKSGTICVADPAAVRLWRGAASTEAELQISGTGGSGSVALPRGATTAAWPAALPVKEGAEYTLSGAGMTTPTRIRFALLGTVPDGLEATAAKLIERGCTPQLDLLVETTALPAQGPGGN